MEQLLSNYVPVKEPRTITIHNKPFAKRVCICLCISLLSSSKKFETLIKNKSEMYVTFDLFSFISSASGLSHDLLLLEDNDTCVDENEDACAVFGTLDSNACTAIPKVDYMCPKTCGICGKYFVMY